MSGNPGARWDAFWWIAGIVLVLVTSLSLAWCYWEELRGDQESLSATVRNVGVVIGGVIAILFAVWRSIVAARQATTAQLGLLNERYQKGAEMLGSKVLAVRLGGIYALARLARDHSGDYHTQIMSLLCAFVRNPTGEPVEASLPINGLTDQAEFHSGWDEEGEDRPLRVREDVQAVMTAVGERCEAQIAIEEEKEYRLDLIGADLKFVRLFDAVLGNVDLLKADLTDAVLIGAKLKSAKLTGAKLTGADLEDADLKSTRLIDVNLESVKLTGADLKSVRLIDVNLEDALLIHTNLSGADLKGCEGLTQEQLNEAVADLDNPPKLEGVVDADTGEPLVWRT